MTDYKQQLLKAYSILAADRNSIAGDTKTWEEEGRVFLSLLRKGASILDIGCGAGRDAVLLRNLGFDYLGIDISEPMLVEARKLEPKAKFQLVDMYKMPFEKEAFDGFWAAASLLHIPKEDINLALREIRRVIKRAGYGFIAVKEGEGESIISGSKPETDRFFSFWQQDEMLLELHKAGYVCLGTNKKILPSQTSTTWLTYFVLAV